MLIILILVEAELPKKNFNPVPSNKFPQQNIFVAIKLLQKPLVMLEAL